MYGEFERSIYDKAWSWEALSYQTLDSKFEELFKKYYWPDFVRDEYLDIERAIKPHFFSTYYTHEYAISAAIANQIAINIYNDKAGFTWEYINFISQWSSKTPAETLKEIWIDINNPSYIESVSDTENEIMNEMEIIINKLKDKK